MRALPASPLAGTPDVVRGLATIRGVPTVVLDAGRLLGDSGAEPRRYVTLRVEDRQVAFAVEDVVGVRSLPAELLEELPPLLREAADATIESVGRLDAELLLVLRAARLVAEEVSGPPARTTPER